MKKNEKLVYSTNFGWTADRKLGIMIFTRAILIFWGNFVINSNFKGIHKNIHILTFICFYVGLGYW